MLSFYADLPGAEELRDKYLAASDVLRKIMNYALVAQGKEPVPFGVSPCADMPAPTNWMAPYTESKDERIKRQHAEMRKEKEPHAKKPRGTRPAKSGRGLRNK